MGSIRCKICSHNIDAITDAQYGEKYHYCKKCNFIFINEEKYLTAKEEKERYLTHNNTFDNEGYVRMFEEFIQKSILPYQNRIKTALDFGCGPGPILASLLKEKGFAVDIYDIYFAPEKIYENKKYDLITTTEVIEHLKNPLETINHLKAHLNKNGILAIMTLFHPENEENFISWWYKKDVTHISFYSPDTLRCIAKILDLKVLMIDDKNICVLEKLYD
jgi:hypothetical protein